MSLFGNVLGTVGGILGIGGQPDFYKGSNALMEHAQALLQGTQHVANPEAQRLALASAQAIKNVQARAASEGWDARTTQVAIQHIQDSLHASLGDAEAQARVQQAQMMMQRAGLTQQQEQAAEQRYQSNIDFGRGLIGATFGGGFPGVWGAQNKSAPVVSKSASAMPPITSVQLGGGVGGGKTVGQAAGPYTLFKDPNAISLNPFR